MIAPVTAAAAAEKGLIRWTMPPLPIRPLKLRLVVEAQTSPSAKTPELMPRQAPQVGLRTQKPASMKIVLSHFSLGTISRSAFSVCFVDWLIVTSKKGRVTFLIVQGLSAFQDYQDTWAFLFVALGFQVAARASRREALTWGGLFLVSALVTMSLEFGLISGLGRALAFIVIGVFLVSFDIQVSQHEDALAESQVLLGELQEAHEKLQAYAARADQLAAVQERERLIQELYDSVGQKVFAIQLAAEATRLMLAKDPSRAALQIEDLQAQTQSALSQMRQLIGQWRP